VKISRTSAVVVAGAATASLLAGGVAYASTTSPAAPISPAPNAAAKHAQRHHGHQGHHRPGLAARAVHGEFVVHNKRGDRVLDVQRGQVTAVTPAGSGTAGTVTLRSVDGFFATYSFTPTSHVRNNGSKATPSSVKVGEFARVRAVKSGGTDSVRGLVARTAHAKAGTTTTAPTS